MRLNKPTSKIAPKFKVVESMKLPFGDTVDLRRLDTNVIIDFLEDAIKKRELPLNKMLRK